MVARGNLRLLVTPSGYSSLHAAQVVSVESGSPADQAGVRPRDFVISVNGTLLDKSLGYFYQGSLKAAPAAAFEQLIRRAKIGDTINIVLWRNKREINVQFKVGGR